MIYSYRRVSCEEQHNGPQAQAASINSWYERTTNPDNDYTTDPGPIDFFDNGVSGSVPFAERPAGVKLVERIESDKEPPTIVVAKLDRLFRSVSDASSTLEHWNKIGVKLVAIAEGFDMTNPYGRAMAQMASVFAELERAMIRERTKSALASKKARGECVGEVPYGWVKSKNGTLAQIPYEQDVINEIIYYKVNGYKVNEIAAVLNVKLVPAKKGGKWHYTQVVRILNQARKNGRIKAGAKPGGENDSSHSDST